MKTLHLFGAMVAVLGAAIVPMSAQTQSTTIQVSKLVGTKVKSAQGEEIGVIKDVVIDRSTGCMAYTVLSTGEGGARVAGGGKLVSVPWTVYSPAADVSVLTVTVDRERIYNAPVFDYARIDEYSRPDYITNVYSYYGVSPGAGVGIGVSGTSTTTGVSGGATGRAGAAGSPVGGASPAATTSPVATTSPAQEASPVGRPTPRPHATASPHERGEATASPSGRRERGTRARPEERESPSSGAELQRESPQTTRESPPEAASPSEGTKEGTQTRRHRKPERAESASPPEGPEEQE